MMPSKYWLLIGSLYLSQGIPSGLMAHALPAMLRAEGVSLEVIGMLKLLALPWVLKWLWAPLVDRYRLAGFGPHRGWILLMQSGAVIILFAMALCDQRWLMGEGIALFLILLALLNALTATQDISTDGLTVKLIPSRFRGLANSIQVGGYKLGMIGASSLFLLLFGSSGSTTGFAVLALAMLCLLIPVLFFNEHAVALRNQSESESDHHWLASYRGFLGQPGIIKWLLVVILYKVADALGSGMTKPLLIDLGLDLADVAVINAVSSGIGILGALLGGYLYYLWGRRRCLIGFGFLQALGMVAYAWLAWAQPPLLSIYLVVIFEQLADAFSTVVLFAVMMDFCRKQFESTDYTIQASLQVLAGGLFGGIGGVLAGQLGYVSNFLLAAMLGLAVIIWMSGVRNRCLFETC